MEGKQDGNHLGNYCPNPSYLDYGQNSRDTEKWEDSGKV